jgi:O-antigen ligase
VEVTVQHPTEARSRGRVERHGALPRDPWLLAFLLPGALIVYLGFNGGGFSSGTVAFATIIVLAALAVRLCVAPDPFEGLSPSLAVAAGALSLYALWTLLSGTWSDAHSRALIEFDRALLYLAVLVFFGSIGRTTTRLRWMLRGIALGIVIVCGIGLITRVLPNLWPIAPDLVNNRLGYPLTYWNALGILTAIGVVFCFHLASSRSEPAPVRVLGAAAVPVLATTLLFTFSRGAIAAGIVGLVAYAFIARPRALPSGLVATVPTSVVAVVVAYDADLLATETPTSPGAIDQGHHVALVVGLCALAAALIRLVVLRLDRASLLGALPANTRARVRTSAWWIATATLIIGSLALQVPQYVGDQYDNFVHVQGGGAGPDVRTRLVNVGNNGRLGEWNVALDEFGRSKFHGHGAGTYQVLWAKERPASMQTLYVRDAHSLYVEVLGELGAVGLLLLLLALVTILIQLATGTLGPNRSLYGAALAAAIAWAIHAGVDWDWEMPAVTLWVFAIGGAVLARPAARLTGSRSISVPPRLAVAVPLILLALVPARISVSQADLDKSTDAYDRGDCSQAVDSARSSISALGSRPEPYEVVGYCNLRAGRGRKALAEIEKAVDRDPRNWEYRYDLALARGASGLDPRPAARAALRLNPFEGLTQEAVSRFRTGDPRNWRRIALSLARDVEL